ncbi:MAG: ankyrin repeat domain-containing protein [Rhodoferax sp.]|nr:ankyrin repeat domain-containing protein [Rhodoferax sp.]
MKHRVPQLVCLMICLLCLVCGGAHAGSYDDFFIAIRHDQAYTIRSLLQRGFDPNTLNPDKEYGLILALRANALQAVAALLESPATRVEVRTAQDESPLMLAALKGHTALCRQLMARDADVNKPGWTPLHYAATGGHVEIVQLLLDNDAYIDAESPNGTTPLMMAARYGNPETVSALLQADADPSLANALGQSALDFARRADHEKSVELIAAALRAQRPSGGW